MTAFFMFLHALICILLASIILMQSGRGGGLTESFASAGESMFGAKTNSVLIKGTAILASLFLVTCLTLAYFSAKRDQSLMGNRPAVQTQPVDKTNVPLDQAVTNAVVETKEAGVETHPESDVVAEPAPTETAPTAQ